MAALPWVTRLSRRALDRMVGVRVTWRGPERADLPCS